MDIARPDLTDRERVEILINPYYAVQEHFLGRLVILGTRYYITFDDDDAFVWFKLKFL